MTVWEQYPKEQRAKYIQFLQVYGALSNLFRQKHGDLIPYLDSKFQETIYAKVFDGENVDIGNTPHDVLSTLQGKRIGIGLKTWMSSRPSFQKVMQLKRYQNEIADLLKTPNPEEALAHKISEIKNERMRSDYFRLGLSEESNIYHYVTRDEGQLVINECAYPLVNVAHLTDFSLTSTALSWSDSHKEYKFTFGDSQIWQKFDSARDDTFVLGQCEVNIIDDPFSFLLKAYLELVEPPAITKPKVVEAYLPLYSFESGEVEEKSGLNAWNGAPKNKNATTPRPLNEVYIPIPREFHKKFPGFFTKNIFDFENDQKAFQGARENKPQLRFHLQLPNGKRIPALVSQSNMKSLQSGSLTERDETGKLYGQSALGQWLLVDVLGLKERTLVTREWLRKKGADSIRLWREIDHYETIHIDLAPIGAFDAFMNGEPIPFFNN